ncbi:MAG: isoprenyl transferase [Bacteroidota bacterium]|nr:isoprenyl transferase [Bacteroidota bacterium]
MSLKDKIDLTRLPSHVAVIMDGNGRWAKKRGAIRIFGHNQAISSVRDVIEAAAEIGVKFLTLYAFSTENWKRPKEEVNALMQLLIKAIGDETKTLMDNSIKMNTIGNINDLPSNCQSALHDIIKLTSNNNRLTVTLALSYSGRWDILEAVKKINADVLSNQLDINKLDENIFGSYLATYPMPDPELMIRTSGELRISNYLLWQLAYAELYITDILWPDFNKENFYEAIVEFQKRERRFGKTSEQIKAG